MRLSILIPVYNERTMVERSLAQVLAVALPENIGVVHHVEEFADRARRNQDKHRNHQGPKHDQAVGRHAERCSRPYLSMADSESRSAKPLRQPLTNCSTVNNAISAPDSGIAA